MQSVPITIKVVSSSSTHGRVYLMQHYVIKFVNDLRQVGGFSRYSVSSTIKTDRHNITEILLKVALNTIPLTPKHTCNYHLTTLLTHVTSEWSSPLIDCNCIRSVSWLSLYFNVANSSRTWEYSSASITTTSFPSICMVFTSCKLWNADDRSKLASESKCLQLSIKFQ